MFKCSHFVLIVISGLIWSVVGMMLMTLGVHHLMDAFRLWDVLGQAGSFSVLKSLSFLFKEPQAAMTVFILICITLGYLKGHFVLSRSVLRGVQQITSYPNPTGIQNLYAKKYYFILFGMMGLGMFLRWLKLPEDLHGGIDLVIGCALLKGALHYFKLAWAEKKGRLVQDK